MILSDELLELAGCAGDALKARAEMVAVVESAAGGLVSAALLAIAGASEFYAGGVVMYTASTRRLLVAQLPIPDGTRGATERFAVWEADVAVAALAAQWGVGETGAAGPAGLRIWVVWLTTLPCSSIQRAFSATLEPLPAVDTAA